MVKTREINKKLNKEELFNENSWNQEKVTLLNLNIIQENECIVEKDYNRNSKENIEPNPFSDTPFYVKFHIKITKSLVLSISFLFYPVLSYILV